MSDSLKSHGLEPTRLLCLWNFPGKNTGLEFLLQGIFQSRDRTCVFCIGRQILYHCTTWETLCLLWRKAYLHLQPIF